MISAYKERVKEAYEREATDSTTAMDDFIIWIDAIIKLPFYLVRDVAILILIIIVLKILFW